MMTDMVREQGKSANDVIIVRGLVTFLHLTGNGFFSQYPKSL